MGLDIAGAIEPTPVADGINAGISVLRGNWFDAGISAAGFILGDLAKLTRIAEYPGRLARAIKLALESERFMKLLLPVLKKLRAALERIPTQRLPDRLRQPLENLKNQLENFFEKAERRPLPKLPQAYIREVEALKDTVAEMRAAGKSSEEIARTVSTMRRDIGIKNKDMTPPEMLAEIYERNERRHGDKLGPTVEWFREQGFSWEEIIEKSTRTGG
jgi:hypothetical protein